MHTEKKIMQQNETKESQTYRSDVNCYCRRQKQQETVSREANYVNEVNSDNIAINERLGFLEKTNSGNDKIFAGDELRLSMSTKKGNSDGMQQ